MTALSGSSVVESTTIPTITNTAYNKSKLKGVGIDEYEMMDDQCPPETLSPPAQPLPVTTVGTERGGVYEDILLPS